MNRGNEKDREDAPPQSVHKAGVSSRALILAFLLTPLNVYFLVHTGYTVGAFTGGESLLANTVAILFLFTLASRFLSQRIPAMVLRPGELLTIYLLLGMSTALTCSVWDFGRSLALVSLDYINRLSPAAETRLVPFIALFHQSGRGERCRSHRVAIANE